MDGFLSKAPPAIPSNRKIANPVKKNVTPGRRAAIMKSLEPRKSAQPVKNTVPEDLRHAIIQDLESHKLARPFQKTHRSECIKLTENKNKTEAEQMQENADLAGAFDDAARAMAEALQESLDPTLSRVETRRARHVMELTTLLNSIVRMIRQKNAELKREYDATLKTHQDQPPWHDDKLIHLDASRLAQAWENKVWRRTYETNQDVESYSEQMEREITDLELWETHFNSELDGDAMFREHFFRHFGGEDGVFAAEYRARQEVQNKFMAAGMTAAPFEFASRAPRLPLAIDSAPQGIREMEVCFEVPSVTFGAQATSATDIAVVPKQSAPNADMAD